MKTLAFLLISSFVDGLVMYGVFNLVAAAERRRLNKQARNIRNTILYGGTKQHL